MAHRDRTQARRLGVQLLAIALVAAGCGGPTASPADSSGPLSGQAAGPIAAREIPNGATAQVDDDAWALADRLSAPDYTTDTTSAMRAALARSGIATVSDSSTDPASAVPETPISSVASPVELLDFQTHALAVGAWAGASWSGEELDTVVPLPDGASGVPSTSALLAAYVASADSPGGALSRALMAGQDLLAPAALRFPAVVLVLFASDLATDGGRLPAPSPEPSAGAGAPPSVVLAVANRGRGQGGVMEPAVDVATICSGPSGWIDAIVSRIKQALELAIPDNLPGVIVVHVFNWLIDIGTALVKNLVNALTAPVVTAVRSIAALIAGVATQIASLLPYAVKVTAVGGPGATFQLGSSPLPGNYTVQITAADLPDWPTALSDCARGARIELPDFRAKPAPVTFGPLSPVGDALLSPGDGAASTVTTDVTGHATWPFTVAPDPGDPGGTLEHQIDRMPVAVHRPELDAARAELTATLLAPVPDLLRPFVAAIFRPLLDGIQGRLNALLDARGTGVAVLDYHDKRPPSRAPSPAPYPGAASPCGVTTPAGTYTGTYRFTTDTDQPPISDHSTGEGPVTLVVAPDGSITGSLAYHAHRVYDATIGKTHDHLESSFSLTGAVLGGSICDLTQSGGSLIVASCRDSMFGDCAGTAPSGGVPSTFHDGPPANASGGHLTWSASHADPVSGVSDSRSLELSGP